MLYKHLLQQTRSCIERKIDSALSANALQQKSEGSKISSMSVRIVFVLLLFSAKYAALIL
jgi:hypothetical protein